MSKICCCKFFIKRSFKVIQDHVYTKIILAHSLMDRFCWKFVWHNIWPEISLLYYEEVLWFIYFWPNYNLDLFLICLTPNLLKTFQECKYYEYTIFHSKVIQGHIRPFSCHIKIFWPNYNLGLRSYGQLLSLFLICILINMNIWIDPEYFE